MRRSWGSQSRSRRGNRRSRSRRRRRSRGGSRGCRRRRRSGRRCRSRSRRGDRRCRSRRSRRRSRISRRSRRRRSSSKVVGLRRDSKTLLVCIVTMAAAAAARPRQCYENDLLLLSSIFCRVNWTRCQLVSASLPYLSSSDDKTTPYWISQKVSTIWSL